MRRSYGPTTEDKLKNKREIVFFRSPTVFLCHSGRGKKLSTQCPKGLQHFLSGAIPPTLVFYIQQGRVKLKVKSKQGKEAVIAILGVGDFFGEGLPDRSDSLPGDGLRRFAPSFILRIEKKEMLRVLHEERGFSDFFLPYVAFRANARTQEDPGRSAF